LEWRLERVLGSLIKEETLGKKNDGSLEKKKGDDARGLASGQTRKGKKFLGGEKANGF